MILPDLQRGEVFQLEGAFYETQFVSPSGRIVLCYLISPDTGQRIPDPDDLTGDVFLTTAFSDLRFNREHETAEDRELASLL